MNQHEGASDRVKTIVSQIMGVPLSTLNDESSPDVIEAWDSLKHMNLVLALEEAFGVRFTDEQILSMSSVRAILTHLNG